MTSTDFHLRRLLDLAAEERSLKLVEDAYTILEAHADSFNGEFSPELLVEFAEVASDLRWNEEAVFRSLEFYDRLHCEDNQFKVRALLVRCIYEARLGSETLHLKGMHLLQQLKYALGFLMEGLNLATKDGRYGCLVYNASRIFWDVVRPICRQGWQRHIVQEATAVLEAVKAVAKPAEGAGGGKAKGGGGPQVTATIPVTLEMAPWLVELSLNVAFGLEDAEKNADAQKTAESALALAEEAKDPKLKVLVLTARAYLARKAPGKMKEDIDKASGSPALGTILFVKNGGIPKEQAEDQLIIAWKALDPEFDLKAARDIIASGQVPTQLLETAKGSNRSFQPAQLIELAAASRAACGAGVYNLAQAMLLRLERLQVPAGRGRLQFDLSRAEVEVWKACNVKKEDPVTKLLLGEEEQQKREVETRQKAVNLSEQCLTTARRLEEIDLVEESAVVLWNIGRELACATHRHRVHKSFQKCAEVLEEVGSISLARLRAHLHFEAACCEVSQDLLTKGRQELNKAANLDCSLAQSDLPQALQQQVNGQDLGPYVRPLDAPIDEMGHLLHWKLNLYEEPSDPADQVMLLLDQVRKQNASTSKLASNLLVQGFSKIEAALDDLTEAKIAAISDVFSAPPLVVTSPEKIPTLPHQAPATVKEGGAKADAVAALVPQPIHDQEPRSDRQLAVDRAKRLVTLMCRIGLSAHALGELDFAIKVCSRAVDFTDVTFGPPPLDVEGALGLAEAAFAKAQCLAAQLDKLGVLPGIDDSKEELEPIEEEESDDEKPAGLSQELKAKIIAKKKDLIASLLFGMNKAYEFKQYWMVSNGLSHWWNIHLELVKSSHDRPALLTRTLQEYWDGLKYLQKFLAGDAALPTAELNQEVAATLALAYVNCGVEVGQLNVLETDQLMVLKRLNEHGRKNLVFRVAELCKQKEKPLPDLARLKPDRLGAAAAVPEKGKKAAAAAPPVPEDKTDLAGAEADIAMLIVIIGYAKDAAEAVKLVDQAVQALNRWEPKANEESALTLWVELWTRLGRQCLQPPMHPTEGAKYALMCGIKGLGGKVDAPMPQYASNNRLHWRGACHGLSGEVFMRLLDPQRQEKESLNKLRLMAVGQFELCCDYASVTCDTSLASFAASSMWNSALPLLHSAETRRTLIQPFTKAVRTLGVIKYTEDPVFFVGLYRALFDCYSDNEQWDEIHEMLNEGFAIIPAGSQRRLWALRMLALSRQGKNVLVAMGKMKESQAKAQAGVWMVLAGASSRTSDQLEAYARAIETLQNAEQPEVVEVRMQFADWLLRHRFSQEVVREQLDAASDLLLQIEEISEDEDEPDEAAKNDDNLYLGSEDMQSTRSEEQSDSDGRSFTSRKSLIPAGSEIDGGRRRRRSSRLSSQRSTRSRSTGRSSRSRVSKAGGGTGRKRNFSRSGSQMSMSMSRRSSAKSKLTKMKKAEEDENLDTQLFAHNYEALFRIQCARSRVSIGEDVHSSLLAAVHFAVNFFTSTVALANLAARKLAVARAEEEKAAAAATAANAAASEEEKGRRHSRLGANLLMGKKRENNSEAGNLIPAFTSPILLSDWAYMQKWPWATARPVPEDPPAGPPPSTDPKAGKAGAKAEPKKAAAKGAATTPPADLTAKEPEPLAVPVLQLILSEAADSDLLEGENCTWAGREDAFARPPLTFHHLLRCLAELEEQGYQLWTFPVLAMLHQLAEIFPIGPVRKTIQCLADMKLGRLASECGIEAAAKDAYKLGRQALGTITATFATFDVEREQARNQKRSSSNTTTDADGEQVPTPWSCPELRAYEVWAALAEECLLQGEAFMACTLADEAIKHAEDYGDERMLCELALLKAQIFKLEGRHTEVIKHLKSMARGDVEQIAEASCLLASCYQSWRQSTACESTLRETLNNLFRNGQKDGRGMDPGCIRQLRAECRVMFDQACMELRRLAAAATATADWISDLQRAIASQLDIGMRLHKSSQYRRRIKQDVDFARMTLSLLEAKRLELLRDPSAAGAMDFSTLYEITEQLGHLLDSAKASRDKLQKLALPVELLDTKAVLPTEGLLAELEIVDARCGILCRRLEKPLKEESLQVSSRVRARSADYPVELFTGDRHRDSSYGTRSEGPPKRLAQREALKQNLDNWMDDAHGEIRNADEQKKVARHISPLESSLAAISNAVATLQCLSDVPQDDPTPEVPPDAANPEVVPPTQTLPPVSIEAMVELGRLQLESAAKQNPKRCSPEAKWRPPACDPYELGGMEIAERYSNVLASKNPQDIAKGPSSSSAVEVGREMEEVAKTTLCKAAQAALSARHFGAARRAFEALALDSYGLQCPEASFEFLLWLQSAGVCLKAEECMEELLSESHKERLLISQIKRLEARYPNPSVSHVWRSLVTRAKKESPIFQRFGLSDLPPVDELLVSNLPPLALVLTLQIHDNFLYLGAASTPPENADPAVRKGQLRRLVTRTPLKESELLICLQRLQELNLRIEKEMISSLKIDDDLAAQYAEVIQHADKAILQPFTPDLIGHFWQYGRGIDHPNNPQKILLLPDSFLWPLPLETFPSLTALIGTARSLVCRDLSLHLLAQRTRLTGPNMVPKSSVLLSDPFNEDKLLPSEDPKSETIAMLHKRLLDAKVITNTEKSLTGKTLTVSAEDVKVMLADSTMFFALGFGRFFSVLNSRHFFGQDLRHVKLLALFHRAQNDNSFRRQTKSESTKTITQQAMENTYGAPLLASFRGVACMVQATNPMPTSLNMRLFESFVKSVQGGKTVAEATEASLLMQERPEQRYARLLEGGAAPGGAAPADGKKGGKAPAAPAAGDAVASPPEDLLPHHTKMSVMIIGLAWPSVDGAEAAPAGGKKKR